MRDQYLDALMQFLQRGGPALSVIALLSILAMALIMGKIFDLIAQGALFSRQLETRFEALARGYIAANPAVAQERIQLLAQAEAARLTRGLRAFDLIAQIAPLIGLLGTVLGMIEAFQALEAAGDAVNPADLAGGIWQALLTTAAGMAVAIPASIALSWFESRAERSMLRMEALGSALLLARGGAA